MPSEAVALGPFTGGMNTRQEIGSIADDEVALLQNFDVDLDGSLVSRPPITQEWAGEPTSAIDALGYYVRTDGRVFLVAAFPEAGNTQVYDVIDRTWQIIWTTGVASSFVQYENKIVMCRLGGAGGYWEAGTFTSTPTMPAAEQIEFYQERFWAFGARNTTAATTVWFSKLNVISPPTSIFTWDPNSDYFTVSRGDGQYITGLLATSGALIIFRDRSTYSFRYPSTPLNGQLEMEDPNIGADNKWSFGRYETSYFVVCQGFFYEFVNARYWQKSMTKMSFARGVVPGGTRMDVRLSIFGRRALVYYYGALYCYNFVTATWSLWVSPSSGAAHFFTLPDVPGATDSRIALAVSGAAATAQRKLFRISETPTSTAAEEMACLVRTKAYSFDEGMKFKRLFWWGNQVRTARAVNGAIYPIAVPEDTDVTWDDLNDDPAVTWDSLNEGTWENPIIKVQLVTDEALLPSATPIMASVRFGRDLQFLRVYFEVMMSTDGTTKTGPVRLYATTVYLSLRAGVTKKVT